MSSDGEYETVSDEEVEIIDERVSHILEIADASRSGDIPTLERLWNEHKNDIDLEYPMIEHRGYFATVLMIAATENQVEVMRFLIDTCQVDTERKELRYGDNALHFAAFYGSLEALQYLLNDCHCSLLSVNNLGLTPLMYACEQGHEQTVRYILSHPQVSASLSSYVNMRNHRAHGALTSLMYACVANHLSIVRVLCTLQHEGEVCCDVNLCNATGKTAIMFAGEYEHIEIVRYLVEELRDRVNLYAITTTGEDVLSYVNHHECRRLIEQARASNIQTQTEYNSSPAQCTKTTGSVVGGELVRRLQDRVAFLEAREKQLETEVNQWRTRYEELVDHTLQSGYNDLKEAHIEESKGSIPVPPHAHALEVLGRELKTLKRLRDEEQEAKLCKICFVLPKNMVCIPCGHMAICRDCEGKEQEHMLASDKVQRTCIVCRARVTSMRQVYEE